MSNTNLLMNEKEKAIKKWEEGLISTLGLIDENKIYTKLNKS